MSWAAAATEKFDVNLLLDDKVLVKDDTVFGSLFEILNSKALYGTHTIQFEKTTDSSAKTAATTSVLDAKSMRIEDQVADIATRSSDAEVLQKVLALLKILYLVNHQISEIVPVSENTLIMQKLSSDIFVSSKLSSKIKRQLDEPLVVVSKVIPKWCHELVKDYEFLVPFDTRLIYLQSTAFGYARRLSRWQSLAQGNSDLSSIFARIQRQKMRILRTHIVPSMLKIMSSYGCSSAFIEIEFKDEAGTGLGPTLEFYSSVCKELRHCKGVAVGTENQIIWRVVRDEEYLGTLFPSPMTHTDSKKRKKVIDMFKFIGIFSAKALIDSRMLDLPFHPLFIELVARRKVFEKMTVYEKMLLLKSVDEQLYKSLNAMRQADDATLSGMCVDFTLPGYGIELVQDGANKTVTKANVEEYIACVLDQTLGSGIKDQIDAFRRGFDKVVSFADLDIFDSEELVSLLGGASDEDWSYESMFFRLPRSQLTFPAILKYLKTDHGFTNTSRVVLDLVKYMSDLDLSRRREFLRFVTGSPRLPIGGFKALQPHLTVVCKTDNAPDKQLPSVMTCVNYLKVPNYSSAQVLKERFDTAVTEGQGSFHLS